MLTPPQKAALVQELRKPDYNGMTAEQAYAFLHDVRPAPPRPVPFTPADEPPLQPFPPEVLPPRMTERFSGSYLRRQGIKTNLGVVADRHTGEIKVQSLSMPNAFDPVEFGEIFREVRG